MVEKRTSYLLSKFSGNFIFSEIQCIYLLILNNRNKHALGDPSMDSIVIIFSQTKILVEKLHIVSFSRTSQISYLSKTDLLAIA